MSREAEGPAPTREALESRVEELEARIRDLSAIGDAHRLSQIVQGSPIPIFVIDRRHRTTHWNRALERLTGFPAEEIIGTRRQWKAFYNSERPVMADLIVDRTPERGIASLYPGKYHKSATIEGAYEAEDFFPELGEGGRWLFFTAAPLRDGAGDVVGALETLQDVTSRKRAEQALRESEERYRVLAEHVADGVMLLQEGAVVFTNPAFNAMFGYVDPRDLAGVDAKDLFPPEMKRQLDEALEALEPDTEERRSIQGPCTSRDGSELWVDMSVDCILLHGKPAALATLRDITESVREKRAMEEEAAHLREENLRLRSTFKDRYRFGDIVGKSEAMQEVYELILKAAATDAGVVLHGESGTGKELVARAIHDASERKGRAFVPVNCGAIPETLIESEFFGYRKGAFTGASTDKAGYLDAAEGGTLFLDEVGEISLAMQVKLLRALGEGGFTPVGSNEAKRTDIRIIAATNKDLTRSVREGAMREDFYYRISIIPIRIPPLRERREDLPLLLEHYWRTYGGDRDDAPPLSGKVIEALMNYVWPGNVRELQNVLHRYITLKKVDFLPGLPARPDGLDAAVGAAVSDAAEGGATTLRGAVEVLEKKLIARALTLNRWHRGKVAAQLGIDPKTLLKKIRSYGLIKPSRKGR